MSNKVIITRVGTGGDSQVRQRISEELNVEFHQADSIEELFPLLSNPHYHTDFINIDVEELYKNNDADVFEIIQTLHTLVKCTVERPIPNGKPIKRQTKIGALISGTTPSNIIRQIMKMSSISFILPKFDDKFSYDIILSALKDQIEGVVEPNKHIMELLKNKTKQAKSTINKILLTPRQEQIVDMICNKGASNKIIARMLGISESTVKLHVSQVFKKYGVKSRTQLAVFTRK